MAHGFRQVQDSWFGVLHYQGRQNSAYANLQYELFWGKNRQHDLKTGVSYRHLRLRRRHYLFVGHPAQLAGAYRREENIPGVFAESVFNFPAAKAPVITGLRADRHNTFGWYATPRVMLRYQPRPNTDLRASIGTGWRTVNLFSENINLLTGSDIKCWKPLHPSVP